jgi:hypothetical protein
LVVVGARSKFGLAALVVMLAAAIWLFAADRPVSALLVLAVTAANFARVPAAIGFAIGLGLHRLRSIPRRK